MSCHNALPVGIKGKYMSAVPMGSQGDTTVQAEGYTRSENGCFYELPMSLHVWDKDVWEEGVWEAGEIVCL